MLPARQRFERRELSGPQVEDRLVGQRKLIQRALLEQRGLDRVETLVLVAYLCVEQLRLDHIVAFGKIKRCIGIAQRLVDIRGVLAKQARASARPDADLRIRQTHWFAQLP